jgi:RND family efflux transporter MFP subunit
VKRVALALAKQTRLDSEVRAPFDGIVEQRHVVPGVYVQAGDPVVTLVSAHPLRFQVGVPERDAPSIRVGQSVRIQIDGRTLSEKPKITRISPAVDVANRSLLVEAEVDNRSGELRTGSFVEGWIEVEPAATTLCAPASAVLEFAGVEKVWLERNGKAEQRIVQTGRRDGGRIEIVDGLREGDRVVRDAAQGRFGPVALKLTPARAAAAAPAGRTSK